MKLLKKLGAKQILGNPSKVFDKFLKEAEDGMLLVVYTICGIAKGVKTGVSQSTWIKFLGDFEAENFITGDKYRSPECFIPAPLDSILMGALEENEAIEFSFTVEMKKMESSLTGYEWIVTPHTEVKQSDALSHLRTLAIAPPVQKPAEKKEAKKAAKGKAA